MTLTDKEIKDIEKEFQDWLHDSEKPYPYYAYIAGATEERIKAKKLLEVLFEIVNWNDDDNDLGVKSKAQQAINEYNKTQL